MGETITPMSSVWPGSRARLRPSAASVPSTVASAVVAPATIRLLRKDNCHGAEVKNSSYQRSDSPGSGKVRKVPELNDSGTMIRIGRIKKPRTRMQNAQSAWRHRLSVNRARAMVPGMSVQLQPVDADQARVEREQEERDDQEYRAERRGHAPVDRLVGEEGHVIADHLVVGAADQGGRDVVADGEDEHEEAAG